MSRSLITEFRELRVDCLQFAAVSLFRCSFFVVSHTFLVVRRSSLLALVFETLDETACFQPSWEQILPRFEYARYGRRQRIRRASGTITFFFLSYGAGHPSKVFKRARAQYPH